VTEVLGQHLIVAQALGNVICTDIGVTAVIEELNTKIASTSDRAPLPVAPLPSLTRATLVAATPQERQQQIDTYLCQQLARTLGLAPTELVLEQSLHEIGFDSLMAVDLRYRIEAYLGLSVPAANFFQKLSIHALRNYLLEQLQTNPTTPSRDEVTNLLSYSLDDGLIPIQTDGSKPPLVCIHPGGLDVSCYQNLARHLDRHQPLYALQPLDLDHYRDDNQLSTPACSIKEMATRCLKAIQKLQPEGPYYLGGWSLGGCVAFEIAQQLRQQGQQVALLALLDVSNTPPNDENLVLLPWFASYLGARRYQELPLQYDTLSGLNLDEQLNSVLQVAIEVGLLAPDTQLTEIRRLFSAYKKGVRASLHQVQQYHLQPYPEPIILCQASKTLNQFNNAGGPQQLWNQLNQLSVQRPKTYIVPGDHYTMWLEPHVQTLAQILQHSLDQAEQNKLSSWQNKQSQSPFSAENIKVSQIYPLV
jgi:thioesterase domain-containing protein/acyl carrier protein